MKFKRQILNLSRSDQPGMKPQASALSPRMALENTMFSLSYAGQEYKGKGFGARLRRLRDDMVNAEGGDINDPIVYTDRDWD